MLKPSDVPTRSTLNPEHMAQLEKQFDGAIALANESGIWPAKVPVYRDMVSAAEIAATIELYCAAGWVCRPGQQCRAVIEFPKG